MLLAPRVFCPAAPILAEGVPLALVRPYASDF
jgi:hypothetical protein